jgi:hypothetical protein
MCHVFISRLTAMKMRVGFAADVPGVMLDKDDVNTIISRVSFHTTCVTHL